ncbi:MAG: TonB-dependent receptor [Gammaproteobacteria bacterium]|nr:TonB-dependent receptor [Gammaproteobacteria bacterium]
MNDRKRVPFITILLAWGALALPAAAQESAADESEADDEGGIEEVVVTGFRSSLMSSIQSKRNADSIVEVITAEDIGGLPDFSIADSLSRVAGITTTRSGGQASDIQIRGLGDEFVFATMKGREQVSPHLRRTIEFNQYPSELINRVTINKTPKASLIEGGVAGTVDLDIVNPLDNRQKRRLAASLRRTFNDRAADVYGSDESGYRLTLSWQEKLLDDTLGLSLGYSRLSQPSATVQFHADTPGRARDIYPVTEDEIYAPQTIQFYQIGGLEVRDAYIGSMQIQPDDRLSIQGDVFYTEFSTDTSRDGVSLQGSASYSIANPRLVDGNYLVGAQFYDGTNIFVVAGDTSDDDDVLSSGLNVEWTEGTWSVAFDYSHSSASGFQADGYHYANVYRQCTAEDPVCTRTGYTRENGQVHWQGDGLKLPNIAFSERLDDFDTLRMTQYGKYPRLSEDKVSAGKIDFEIDLDRGIVEVLRFGVRSSWRNYTYGRQVFQYGPGSGYVHDVDMPITASTGDVVCWGGDYSHFPCFISFDAEAILRQAVGERRVLQCDPQAVYNCEADQLGPDGRPLPRSTATIARWGLNNRSAWSVRQRGDVSEDVLAYYVEVDIALEVMARALSGNVGVRMVGTDQASVGIYDVFGDPALNAAQICDDDGRCRTNFAYVGFGDQYSKAFPSLNLTYELTADDYLRFGAARVMSRPPINRLSSDQPVDGGGGNFIDDSTASEGYVTFNFSNTNSPFLRPFEAVQVDFSFEHYFGDAGLFAVAAYHKDIKSFIQELSVPEFDFRANGFVIPETYEAVVLDEESGGAVVTPVEVRDGSYTFAINNKEGGYIQGVELSWTQTLDAWLPDYLGGFGFNASVAFVDSEITVDNPFSQSPSPTFPYPGLADRSGNLTVFYERGGLEARLGANYQSAKVSSFGVAFAKDTVFDEEIKIDAQISYAFDNGIDILLQAYNLTDEPNRSYWGEEYLTGYVQNFGREIYLGLDYSF